MTLIIALPVPSGIVVASDGQITMGPVRTSGQKLYRLNNGSVWAASGEVALFQRVAERLGDFPYGLHAGRPRLTEAIKESVTELLQEDFRTPFLQSNPENLLLLHLGDFVFAECPAENEESRILHVAITGTAEWISGHAFATGNGDLFAYALLRKFDLLQLSIQEAELLAVKVIEEAIEVGSYGLGPPIQMLELTTDGVREVSEAEIAALSDAARLVREQERQLLAWALFPPIPEEQTSC